MELITFLMVHILLENLIKMGHLNKVFIIMQIMILLRVIFITMIKKGKEFINMITDRKKWMVCLT